MNKLFFCFFLVLIFLFGCTINSKNFVDHGIRLSNKAKIEERNYIIRMKRDVINKLLSIKPSLINDINNSFGYGVFEVNGLNKIIFNFPGRGAIFKKNGDIHYIKMINIKENEFPKPYWYIIIFNNIDAINYLTSVSNSFKSLSNYENNIFIKFNNNVLLKSNIEEFRFLYNLELN